jgi:lysophospholipase L1-like esterase
MRRRTWLLAPLGVAVLLLGGCAIGRLQVSKELARQATPFDAEPARPTRRLLVVGDSTAVGTGASSSAQSLFGLIGRDHPDWQIENLAANGARYADLPGQLDRASTGNDLVLILAGGNDVMRLTGADALHAQVEQAVAQARRHGRTVVLMPCGNVGHAPFFLPPVSWWMGERSKTLHAIVAEVAQRTGSRYVRLLKPRDADPFVQQAALLNAADGLHPSDAGYRQWYEELVGQGGLAP